MKEITKALLDSFKSIDWLKNIGVPIVGSVKQLNSWNEVAMHIDSDEWGATASEMANQIGVKLLRLKVAKAYDYDWNEVPNLVRPTITKLVASVLTKAGLDGQPINKQLSNCMKWNLMHWIIETEHSAVLTPGYFTMLGDFYKSGHYPCGWQGANWPDGFPVIY